MFITKSIMEKGYYNDWLRPVVLNLSCILKVEKDIDTLVPTSGDPGIQPEDLLRVLTKRYLIGILKGKKNLQEPKEYKQVQQVIEYIFLGETFLIIWTSINKLPQFIPFAGSLEISTSPPVSLYWNLSIRSVYYGPENCINMKFFPLQCFGLVLSDSQVPSDCICEATWSPEWACAG